MSEQKEKEAMTTKAKPKAKRPDLPNIQALKQLLQGPSPCLERPDIEGINERAEKATEGPWEGGQEGNLRVYGPHGLGAAVGGLLANVFKGRDNVSFIAHARTDVPDLCAYALRLEKEISDLYRSGHIDAIKYHSIIGDTDV